MNKDKSPLDSAQMLDRHMKLISDTRHQVIPGNGARVNSLPGGLASLQQATLQLMDRRQTRWGFGGLPFRVVRRKLAADRWRLTVEDPRTRSVILEAEGCGDKIFAYEDSLARMAEALTDRDLVITTPSRS